MTEIQANIADEQPINATIIDSISIDAVIADETPINAIIDSGDTIIEATIADEQPIVATILSTADRFPLEELVNTDVSNRQDEDLLYFDTSDSKWKNRPFKFDLSFTVSDWVLNGDEYELTAAHNLDTTSPKTEIYENTFPLFVNAIERIDENTVKLHVPASPDLRFAGKLSITK